MIHATKYIFLLKYTKTFTLIESKLCGEKKMCHRTDQRGAKTNLKVSELWIPYG